MDRFIGLAERCSNVYLDISGVVMLHKIQDAVSRVGSERVIWGTDGPHKTPDTANYARLSLGSVRMLNLGKTAEADVLGGSIMRLIGG